MFDKRFLQNFLKLNGVDSANPAEEEVRACLAGAGWSEKDIEEAFGVMGIKKKPAAPAMKTAEKQPAPPSVSAQKETKEITAKVQQTEKKEKASFMPKKDSVSEELSDTLSAKVVVDPKDIEDSETPQTKKKSAKAGKKWPWILASGLFLIIIVCSIAVLVMYSFDIGPFRTLIEGIR